MKKASTEAFFNTVIRTGADLLRGLVQTLRDALGKHRTYHMLFRGRCNTSKCQRNLIPFLDRRSGYQFLSC